MSALNQAIATLMKTDAELIALGVTGVHKDIGPQGTASDPVTWPYIIYGKQGGTWRTNHDGGTNRFPRYFIKVVDQGNSTVRAENIDERIAALFSAEKIATSEGDYLCLRTGDMPDYAEVSSGKKYQHIGGLYRFGPA